MKTTPFTTAQGEFLAVEIEKDSENHYIVGGPVPSLRYNFKNSNYKGGKPLWSCKYQIISKQSEMTEELAKSIVSKSNDYFNRNLPNLYPDFVNECNVDTALESFKSLMNSLELFTENPLGESERLILRKIS